MIATRQLSRQTLAIISAAAWILASACTKSPTSPATTTTPPPATCTVTTGTTTTTFAAEGGSASVSVTAPSGCAWTAASSANFVTISQGASGSGNGTVQFAVGPNAGADRTATLTITGTTITITQRAPSAAPPSLSAPATKSPAGGQTVDSLRPTLVANNAAATGNVGTVSYRFEISEIDSFPANSRTETQDGVAQGTGGATSWTVSAHDLAPGQLYFWRVRATNGTITSAFSNTETFRTPGACTFTLSATSVAVGADAGTAAVGVTAGSACAWTAASNDAFITVTSGASGIGTGTVTIALAANAGASRTGTLTIAGQTVTITQAAAGQSGALVARFRMFDPARQAAPTTECQFRSLSGQPTTCTLEATSFPLGTNFVVSHTWTVQYTYGTVKTLTGDRSTLSFSDVCGQFGSTDDGVPQPLSVTLTSVDNLGNSATATSGSGGQPALVVRLFTCGQ